MHIPASPPRWKDQLAFKEPALASRFVDAGRGGLVNGRYVHWDKLRFLKPPQRLTLEQWWAALKLSRSGMLRDTALTDTEGNPFRYAMVDALFAYLHQIDRDASGRIEIAEEVTNPDSRDRYIVSSLIEESITSSQLEGAATTTPVAKEMLRTGRRARTPGEQMIRNNYQAMSFVRSLVGKPISPERIFEIHRIVTQDTLAEPSAAGRLRRADELVVVADDAGTTIHVPPPAKLLAKRLRRMCEFANEKTSTPFFHPLLRAITLHFWLGFDHPFVDGNGRTARAVFYWAMLNSGYWLTEFISISKILRAAPAKYPRSFLYTETDENDLTYFVLYQLSVLSRAIADLHAHLRQKASELRATERLLTQHESLNHRQLALLGHAIKHPGFTYTIRSHQSSHGVVYQTARADLLDLKARALLEMRRRGTALIFSPAQDLKTRIQRRSR
jgi:Fic family protein